jgi:predicted GNAT superfamily acetyltransferase
MLPLLSSIQPARYRLFMPAPTPARDNGDELTIKAVSDPSDLRLAQRIFDEVWPPSSGEGTQIQSNLMRALVHSGGYVSVAWLGGVPVGAALAVVGRHRDRTTGEWHTHLHSHMAGVLEGFRDRRIGTALKMHQREWALESGIDTIVWTFDPLVRRNAWLNVINLGADVEDYEPDFYGEMNDGINSGDRTDRVFAWWRLESPRAIAASAGETAPLDVDHLVRQGRDVMMIETPSDIVDIRMTDMNQALHWRMNMRERFTEAFGKGYRVIGIDAQGSYVLEGARNVD